MLPSRRNRPWCCSLEQVSICAVRPLTVGTRFGSSFLTCHLAVNHHFRCCLHDLLTKPLSSQLRMPQQNPWMSMIREHIHESASNEHLTPRNGRQALQWLPRQGRCSAGLAAKCLGDTFTKLGRARRCTSCAEDTVHDTGHFEDGDA